MVDSVKRHDPVKTCPGGVGALDGLSTAVAPGEVLVLLGPNGEGKSTTVKILTTLARPDSGSAVVAGHDAIRPPDRVRRVIRAVAPRSRPGPHASRRGNPVVPGRLFRLRRARLRRRLGQALGPVDLHQ